MYLYGTSHTIKGQDVQAQEKGKSHQIPQPAKAVKTSQLQFYFNRQFCFRVKLLQISSVI